MMQSSPTGSIAARTILIVEDEEFIAELLRMFLDQMGYRVLHAEDGDVAQQILVQSAPEISLVISDMMLPGMDGMELSRHIMQEYPHIKIVLCSGDEEYFRSLAGRLETKVGFLPKPFTASMLRDKMNETLAV
jgi:two-component system, cell cycle sensor histidine kinase and response regulator CckA